MISIELLSAVLNKKVSKRNFCENTCTVKIEYDTSFFIECENINIHELANKCKYKFFNGLSAKYTLNEVHHKLLYLVDDDGITVYEDRDKYWINIYCEDGSIIGKDPDNFSIERLFKACEWILKKGEKNV